jgi:hypothetical protein
MTKENRFEGLMGVVGKNKNAQTSKQSSVETSKSSNVSTSNKPNIQTSATQTDNSNSAMRGDLGGSPHEPSRREAICEAVSFRSPLGHQENVPASKHTDVQPSKKAKSVNPDYTRTTVYLPKKMHKKLKAIALDEEKEMSSILEELIETWLSSRK